MRDSQAGFSMIEGLVAMSVLAVAATGLLNAAETSVRQAGQVNERVLARWVTEDLMARVQAGAPVTPGRLQAWDRTFDITIETLSTDSPYVGRVAITAVQSAGGVASTLVGYQMTEGTSQ